jgi:SAM-dependent methyltransferase
MALEGPAFYDDEGVFATYATSRERPFNANDTLEKPVFDELVGGLAGRRILDLGCGDAGFGREALQAGCSSYLGLEGSERMVEQAQANLAGSAGRVILTPMESWKYPTQQFDLVTSRLALHYIEELDALCRNVFQTLIDGGRFIFSVEHPVITSCNRARPDGGLRQDWIVDDYFESGRRVTNWMGGEVVKYHRTVEEYFLGLQTAGFVVDALRESRPQRHLFPDEATYQRRQRIPLILFLLAVRPHT